MMSLNRNENIDYQNGWFAMMSFVCWTLMYFINLVCSKLRLISN
jgi:hypothetical protein